MNEKKITGYKIDHGTVIDHIATPNAIKIIDIILKLSPRNDQDGFISIGMNLDSHKIIKKDIIKLENIYLDKNIINIIALLSPTITISIITNQNVIEKKKIEVPKQVNSVIKCPNPNCITNFDIDCLSKFYLSKNFHDIVVGKCHYCERETNIVQDLLSI